MILNFANCDMVGHTGIIPAAVKAVGTVDECVKKVTKKVTCAYFSVSAILNCFLPSFARYSPSVLAIEVLGKAIPAAVKAVGTVDECVKKVTDKILEMGGTALLTADHGLPRTRSFQVANRTLQLWGKE